MGRVGLRRWGRPPCPRKPARRVEVGGVVDAGLEARAELVASRARVVTAGDDARRRVVRDLHDGAQQSLVHTVLTLNLAQRAVAEPDESAPELVAEALEYAQQGNEALRELEHGLLC